MKPWYLCFVPLQAACDTPIVAAAAAGWCAGCYFVLMSWLLAVYEGQWLC